MIKKKKVNKLSLRKKADQIFSRYIRQRDKGVCYTCNKEQHWKSSQCGHFVPRQYLALRYDEVNCHAQCYADNILYNGQPSAYAKRLEKDYGLGTVEMLEKKRREICPNFDYQFIISEYTAKCKALGYEI